MAPSPVNGYIIIDKYIYTGIQLREVLQAILTASYLVAVIVQVSDEPITEILSGVVGGCYCCFVGTIVLMMMLLTLSLSNSSDILMVHPYELYCLVDALYESRSIMFGFRDVILHSRSDVASVCRSRE